MSVPGAVTIAKSPNPLDIPALIEEITLRFQRLPARTTSALRALRREYSKRLKPAPAADVVKIAAALIAARRLPRFFADELIATRADALATLDRTKLERLASGLSSWDQVDCFASYLSGPAWREGNIESSVIAEWAQSNNRWWRRAALVSTVPLNVKARGGKGDARRTLSICQLLVADRDEMVVKALSWALRALAPQDPQAVRQFLDANETRLAPLVRREVRRKLLTGRKT